MTTKEAIAFIAFSPLADLAQLVIAMRARCDELSEQYPGDEIASPSGYLYQAGIQAACASIALDECQSCIKYAMGQQEEVAGREK